MITISLCMIVKNEEHTLDRCLSSVADAVDEIIILDTGSTDRTKEVAGRWTSNVIDFEWNDHFAAARDASFAEATMDYILWLDADDVLLSEDNEKLCKLKQSLSTGIDAVTMRYHCDFDNDGNVTLSVRRVRLVKRSRNYKWEGAVHEDLSIREGTFYDSDIVVTHRKPDKTSDPDRNLRIYEKLISGSNELTARDMLHYAMELHQHRSYERATQFYLKFLEADHLSAENRILAYTRLADCYYYLGDRQKELAMTCKTFEYDVPRPEACCRIGYFFMERDQFTQAIYWYKAAIAFQPGNDWAVHNAVSATWLPHMQLGLCYYRLGDYERSYYHNKMAHGYVQGNENIVRNMRLLENLIRRVDT
ncbi:MAG: glycosyltransferase [Paenibacillus sp.]|nr:glycosyltransferase [Paenibacillus sp.]